MVIGLLSSVDWLIKSVEAENSQIQELRFRVQRSKVQAYTHADASLKAPINESGKFLSIGAILLPRNAQPVTRNT
jgi:hypothetical protein